MASIDVWSVILKKNVHRHDGISGVNETQNKLNGETPIAVFFGNPTEGGHWLSRKPGSKTTFDPYDEYQVHGTNQFCQTYALMNLAGALPNVSTNRSDLKYYSYTKSALDFIKREILKIDARSYVFRDAGITKAKLLQCIDVCLNNSNLCFNGIELKPRELL